MLSLANVKAIQASNYYAKDDYYSRSSTEGDTWQGKLWKEYGTSKALVPEEFQKALQAMPNPERAAIDLTFSAPKSVSIAMILNDTAKADVLAAHCQAVKETLAEIEENEIEARVTQNGVTERVKTGNLAAAKFQHFVSRNQDMQLHTHCVILNRTEYKGKSYAVSNENLYKNHILYGQLYRNRLARQLQAMGYACRLTDAEKGFFELADVAQETIDHFSTRRAEIVGQLNAWNTSGAAAASKATLLTRKAKETKDLAVLEQAWRAQIDEMGGLSLHKGERIKRQKAEAQAALERAVKRLAEKQFAFSRRALERAVLAEGCLFGMERADFTALLEHSALLCLGKAKGDDENIYYTTDENIKIEQEIKENLQSTLQVQPLAGVKESLAQISREKEWTLSEEQTETILRMAETKGQYMAVQGLAGTGKTYMLNAAREIYERRGWNVYGASFTGKAAEGLAQEANIKSTTLHSFLNRLEKEAGNRADSSGEIQKTWNFTNLKPGKKPEVWIIDEAGLTDNDLILHLQRAARLKQAKVVLVGDYQQLAPVGVGNAYSNFVQSGQIATCYMTEIRRQRNQELLQAVKAAVSGNVKDGLAILANQTTEIKKASARFKAIAKEYVALDSTQQSKPIVLTAKNKDRLAINTEIQGALLRTGGLEMKESREFKIACGKEEKEERRLFAPRERVIFTKNNHALGIMNGQAGTIESIHGHLIRVSSNGKLITIDSEKYKHLDYGYCVTSHKAQGITVDNAIIHIDSTQRNLNTRNAFYVNISRARSAVTIYTDNKAKLNEQVGTWVKKLTSDDFLIQNVTKDFPKVKIEKQALSRFSLPNFQNNLVGKALHTCSKTAELGAKLAFRALTKVTKASSDEIHTNSHHRGMRM